ncbi:MAG: hypothetical protein PVG22_05320 [Chromatiales bacterium]|jgi:hypothetical protein
MGYLRSTPFDEFDSLDEWSDVEFFEPDDPDLFPQQEAIDRAEQIHEFLLRTPELTASEQAELTGSVVEDADWAGERGSRNIDWGRIARGVQTGLSLFQTGAQIAGGIAGAVGGNSQTARDFSRWSNRLGQGAGQINRFMQALQGRQIPSLPRGGQRPASPRPPAARPATGRPTATPTAAPGRGQFNATALLGLIMNNPQLMQAIRGAPFARQAGVRRVEVNIPNGESVSIPLADVLNTFAVLAQESVLELNDTSSEYAENIPEYLIGEDGEFIVDPQSAEDRAALVLHLLRLDGEMERYAEWDDLNAYDETEESDLWVREAGFDD